MGKTSTDKPESVRMDASGVLKRPQLNNNKQRFNQNGCQIRRHSGPGATPPLKVDFLLWCCSYLSCNVITVFFFFMEVSVIFAVNGTFP